jgi:hypothetical protein
MKSKPLAYLSAAVLGAAIATATPAMAFRGGGVGGGGMHFGGGGFGGMHGGFSGGGMHFGGAMPFSGGGFRGGMVTGRSVFVPGAGRFAGAPFAGQRLGFNRFNNFAFQRNPFFFRNHHFRNFVFVGAPFAWGRGWPYYGYGYNGCWQQVWTGYGYQWVNACYNYGY